MREYHGAAVAMLILAWSGTAIAEEASSTQISNTGSIVVRPALLDPGSSPYRNNVVVYTPDDTHPQNPDTPLPLTQRTLRNWRGGLVVGWFHIAVATAVLSTSVVFTIDNIDEVPLYNTWAFAPLAMGIALIAIYSRRLERYHLSRVQGTRPSHRYLSGVHYINR